MKNLYNNKYFNIFYWILITIWFMLAIWPIFIHPLTGDEADYFYYTWTLKNDHLFYNEFWNGDKGPGIQLLFYAFSFFKDNFLNFYAIKIGTVLYQFVSVIIFFIVSKEIFKKFKFTPYLLLPIFILVYLNPFIEGQISNADNFPVLFILFCAYAFIKKRYYVAAFFIGLSFLIKQNTALEILPTSLTIMILLFSEKKPLINRISNTVKILSIQFLVFLLPSIIFSLYMIYTGNFQKYLDITFLDRIQSHITYKNYDFAKRYIPPILKQTSILWTGMLLFFIMITGMPLLNRLYLKMKINSFYRTIKEQFHNMFSKDILIYLTFWVIFAVISVWVGGYFFPHYFIEIIPILILSTAIISTILHKYFFYSITGILSIFSLVSILFLPVKNISSIITAIIIIVSSGILFFKENNFEDITIPRITTIFFMLIMTLSTNPVSKTISLSKSKDPFVLYSKNDKDIYNTAIYIREAKLQNIFIHDYTQEIYYYTMTFPICGYATKIYYINYSKIDQNHGNYYSIVKHVPKTRKCLMDNLANDSFKYIIINYNLITKRENKHIDFLLKHIIARYDYHKNFGGVWIYKLREKSRKQPVLKNIIKNIAVSYSRNIYSIQINYDGLIPFQEASIQCGSMNWHYPEDGLRYPMTAKQGLYHFILYANERGLKKSACDFTFDSYLDRSYNYKIKFYHQ